MNLKHSSLLILLLTVITFSAIAESGSVTGRITDEKGLPLPGANVVIKGADKASITDVKGYFTIVKVPAGDYSLDVTYIGYESQSQEINVTDNASTTADFVLTAGIGIAEVTITSNLEGQAKALNQQKNNMNVSNVISSDQVGRFPDANIGDALKRIPGINVQYDQGEARFGSIRGTEPRLNSVSINGERIPSAEAEARTIQLDLVPSDMIQTVELNKALTPDMDADAIGGSINLVTRTAPSKRRLSLTAGSGYNALAGKPIWNGALVYGDRFMDDKVGVILSGSYHNHNLGSDNLEAEWDVDDDGNAYVCELQTRQYYLQRIRQSVSATIDFKLNSNNIIYLTGIYNHRNDWENRYRTVYKYDPEDEEAKVERQTKAGTEDNKYARLEDQRAMNFGLRGDHLVNNTKIDWGVSYSKASEERPNERYLEYEGELDDYTNMNFDLSDTKAPTVTVNEPAYADFSNSWEFSELTEEYQYTEDVDYSARLNIEIPLLEGTYANSLKFGYRGRFKSKMRENDFYEYTPVDEDAFNAEALSNLVNMTEDDFYPGDYEVGNIMSEEWVGSLDLENEAYFEKEQVIEELAGNFEATENINAGYIMLNQKIGSDISIIAGVRLEHTSLENFGYEYNEGGELEDGTEIDESLTKTETVTSSYLDVLPGLHVKYNLAQNTVLRAAWTNTIARPNYFDLVPYVELKPEDYEIGVGNPDLKPTYSMNIDLMAEHYFKSIGMVSGGLFYKDLSNMIASVISEIEGGEYDGWEQETPENVGDATILGFEVAFQRQLDFLPSILKNIGIYGNYTYTTSSFDEILVEGREDEDLRVPGSADHTLNGSIGYESKLFSIRISLNYTSDYFDADEGAYSEDGAFYDRYYDEALYLDINGSVNITDQLRFFCEANNLTNQPLRFYQGDVSRTMQAEYYGSRFTAGLKFDL